jgi:hypothetical protein
MGIIQRDIKPSNMMLNQQGIVKVMDFGIAKVLGARGMTKTGTQMGTAFYMSPEQVLNKGVDIRSDIYSLGVTLYEMLTANVPFGGDSDYQIMTDHVNTPPPLLTRFYPYVPAGVQNAVLKSLEKNPDARFQTVEEFGAALEHPDNFGVNAAAPVVVAAPVVAAAAVPAPAGVAAGPVVAAGVAAPPKSSFWTAEKKIIAGGIAAALMLVGAWAALRPHPKKTGTSLATAAGNGGIAVPSSGATLTVLKEGGVPPLPSNSSGKGGAGGSGSQGFSNPKDSTGTPPPVAAQLVIPAGTPVMIRMIDSIDTSRNRAGQRFAASIDSPVVVRGRVVIPRGANARVLLANSSQAGHIEGRSAVSLELISVSIHGVAYPVRSNLFTQQGSSRGKRSAVVIGGGAAVGAAIGGIFGRKRGAAEGAVAGAGAGTGAQLMTKAEVITIPSETRIDFVLHSPIVLSR